mgnify:CR=1 FL=1|tara:strand:- start:2583 stop:3035 length:453 start_codon:yes stop_codon:yes gene_type:complete
MTIYKFTVVKGHQVASGCANDPRFPKGTIAAQTPFFRALGLELAVFHPATLNAQFNCDAIILKRYDHFFKQVKWHKDVPPEDFKFCRCHILVKSKSFPALIYQPQLVTKKEHLQPLNQLEILAPFIPSVLYGDVLTLDILNATISLSVAT